MDFKTPTIISLGFLLVALALSVLGLAADNMSFAHAHHDSNMQIHYIRFNETAQAQYTYWLKMDYTPSRFSLARESALLAGGLISALAGASIIATTSLARKAATNTRFGLAAPLISFAFATTALITSLAVTIYAWHPVMHWDINFLKSLPVPNAISGAATNQAAVYQAPFAFTPEIWNCYLAPYVADSGTSEKLQNLCAEAKAAKSLAIPVVVLAALLAAVSGWAWWSASRAARTEPEMQVKSVDEISMVSKE